MSYDDLFQELDDIQEAMNEAETQYLHSTDETSQKYSLARFEELSERNKHIVALIQQIDTFPPESISSVSSPDAAAARRPAAKLKKEKEEETPEEKAARQARQARERINVDLFQRYLLQYKRLRRVRISGNGMCLYNAISQALHGTERHAQHYKDIAMKMHQLAITTGDMYAMEALFLHDNAPNPSEADETLDQYLDQYQRKAQAYIKKYKEYGVYGGEPEVNAIVNYLNEWKSTLFLCVIVWSEQSFTYNAEQRFQSDGTAEWNPFNSESLEERRVMMEFGQPEPARERQENPAKKCEHVINLYYTGGHYDLLVPDEAYADHPSSRK